jgi:hypothetical protein
MPDESPDLTVLEMPHIKSALPTSIAEMDNIKSQVGATRQSLDVDTLFHVRRISLQQEKQTHWHLIMAITSCTITFFLIIYFSFHFKLFPLFLLSTPFEPENKSPPSYSNIPKSEYTKAATEIHAHKETVTFTGYPLHQTAEVSDVHTLSQPANFPGYTKQTSDNARAAISRPLSQHLLS